MNDSTALFNQHERSDMTSYQVKTLDAAICAALMQIAAANGKSGLTSDALTGHHFPYLVLDGDRLCWNDRAYGQYQTVTIEGFVELLKKGPPITIGKHTVHFGTVGIRIGDLPFIHTETVDRIHARLHEGEEQSK